jgi:N-acetylglutamate synthase-like GNAT family acetyltransferase
LVNPSLDFVRWASLRFEEVAAHPEPSAGLVSIRKATPEDGPAILACLQAAFEPFRSVYTPGGFVDTVLTPETLARRIESMTIFVATTPDDEVVGTLACGVIAGGEGHLRGMAVLPTWQGRGVEYVKVLTAIN